LDSVLGQEDYFKGYQDQINKLKDDPGRVEFDRLCYEVFGKSEAGKKLLEYVQTNIISAAVPAKMDSAYGVACSYYEGYREGFRQLVHATKSYPIRVEAEQKRKAEGLSK